MFRERVEKKDEIVISSSRAASSRMMVILIVGKTLRFSSSSYQKHKYPGKNKAKGKKNENLQKKSGRFRFHGGVEERGSCELS